MKLISAHLFIRIRVVNIFEDEVSSRSQLTQLRHGVCWVVTIRHDNFCFHLKCQHIDLPFLHFRRHGRYFHNTDTRPLRCGHAKSRKSQGTHSYPRYYTNKTKFCPPIVRNDTLNLNLYIVILHFKEAWWLYKALTYEKRCTVGTTQYRK